MADCLQPYLKPYISTIALKKKQEKGRNEGRIDVTEKETIERKEGETLYEIL